MKKKVEKSKEKVTPKYNHERETRVLLEQIRSELHRLSVLSKK
jgi:hypothetical protein